MSELSDIKSIAVRAVKTRHYPFQGACLVFFLARRYFSACAQHLSPCKFIGRHHLDQIKSENLVHYPPAEHKKRLIAQSFTASGLY